MKDKILMLVIGVLIGAVVTAGGFLIFSKNNTNSAPTMKDGQRPDMSEMGNFDPNTIPEGGMKGGRGSSNTSTVDDAQEASDI